MNGGRYLPCLVQRFQSALNYFDKFEVLSTLEVLLFFHALSLVESLLCQKKVRVLPNVDGQLRTTIRSVIQTIVKAFTAFSAWPGRSHCSK